MTGLRLGNSWVYSRRSARKQFLSTENRPQVICLREIGRSMTQFLNKVTVGFRERFEIPYNLYFQENHILEYYIVFIEKVISTWMKPQSRYFCTYTSVYEIYADWYINSCASIFV